VRAQVVVDELQIVQCINVLHRTTRATLTALENHGRQKEW
jgi:hypothetical protein